MTPFIAPENNTPKNAYGHASRALVAALIIASLVTPVPELMAQSAPPGRSVGTSLPTLGDNSDISIGTERKIGERVARDLFRDTDYLDDPLLVEYVQRIWQPLLAAARQRGELSPELEERFAFEVLLGRDRQINAFAVPGGYLGLNLGLIGVVSSPDELASVLAHELSHVTQRHIARQVTKQNLEAPLLIASLILGALVASRSPEAANAIITGGQGVTAASQLGFSRDVEREADRIGFAVMTEAGYDPRAFGSMFEKLQQASRLNDSGAFPYLRTHPLTTERIASVRERLVLGEGANPGPAPSSVLQVDHAIMAARARVLSSPGTDVLRGWLAQAQLDLKQQASPSNSTPPGKAPDKANLAAIWYAGALSALQLRDYGAAAALADRLTALVSDAGPNVGLLPPTAPSTASGSKIIPPPINISLPSVTVAAPAQREQTHLQFAQRYVRLLQVELALAQGQPGRAELLVGSSAQARPEVILSAQAVLAQGSSGGPADQGPGAASRDPQQIARAHALDQRLQEWVARFPRDAGAWQLLATAYNQQGQTLRAIRAEAEVHAAHFDYAAALDRFRAAQALARAQSGNVDLIEASIIDTRARQVQSALREQLQER